jgi:periplasmic mercuric ion binding protein
MTRFAVLAAVVGVLGWAAPARAAEVKVELKSVHMCCPGCGEAVEEILKKAAGVTDVVVDQKTRTARFTAPDEKAAQKALDALAEGGFHGDTGGAKGYAFKDDSGAKAGKVKALTVSGFHNSCPGCAKSFREALQNVKGVTGDTAKARVTTCEITGEFDPVELVKELNKAGFHVKVK